MSGQRKSALLERAHLDLANLQSIDPNLDLGNGLSIENLVQLLTATRQSLNEVNTAEMVITRNRILIQDQEKAIADLIDRLRAAISAKYGKKSAEYQAAIKASKRGKQAKSSIDSNDAGNDAANPAPAPSSETSSTTTDA